MQCGKKVGWQRQCYALGNVLPGNLGFWHSNGCYFDTYHLPKNCCKPHIPFMALVFTDGSGFFQQDNIACKK